MVLSVKTHKMGKRPLRCSQPKKIESIGKPSPMHLRDNLLDESNDSGLGSDTYCSISLPSSSVSSDVDCASSDSVDSCLSRSSNSFSPCVLPPLQSRQLPVDPRRPLTSSATTPAHLDSCLARSLDAKMHIQQSHRPSPVGAKRSDSRTSSTSVSELPCAKRRKVTSSGGGLPVAASAAENMLQHAKTPAGGAGVLTESPVCANAVSGRQHPSRGGFDCNGSSGADDGGAWSNARDAFALRVSQNNSSLGTERIAALLSASGNNSSLTRKRVIKRPSLHVCFPAKSRDNKMELSILVQPEEQHRARYMTEGSRGSIKDCKGNGFPTVKLVGCNQPAVLQVFIGSDQGKIQPHLFYQACKVTGKNCTPCNETMLEGTCVIEINMLPENDMTVSCDCIGILKERNVDVEQRLPYFGLVRCKKRSTKCRMVFRVCIPLPNGNYETVQVTSSQILCTQSPGLPEICKKSLSVSPVKGGTDLFIIGKNFQKDAKVVFQEVSEGPNCGVRGYERPTWEEIVHPEKEFLHQSHLVCSIPPYRNLGISQAVKVFLSVHSGGKSSEPHCFTYTPLEKVRDESLHCKVTPLTKISRDTVEIERGFQDRHQMSPPVGMMTTYNMAATGSELQNLLKSDRSMDARQASPTSPSRCIFPVATTVGMPENPSSAVVLKQEFSASPEHSQHVPLTPPATTSPPQDSIADAREQQASLMSGISQLASAIVASQEAGTDSRMTQLVSEVASEFVLPSPPSHCSPHAIGNGSRFLEADHHQRQVENTGFHSGTAAAQTTYEQSTLDSTIPSELSNTDMRMGHLLPLDPSCLGHQQQSAADSAMDAFMAMTSPVTLNSDLAVTSMTGSSQQSLVTMFAGSVEAAVATLHSHESVSDSHRAEVDVALRNLKEETRAMLHDNSTLPIAVDPCSSQSTAPATATTTLTADLLGPPSMLIRCVPPEFSCLSLTADGAYPTATSCLTVSHPPSEMPGMTASATTATSTSTSSVDQFGATGSQNIKREPAAGEPESGAEINDFQQTMSLTLSQMSDADLLSIINPSTFGSEYRW